MTKLESLEQLREYATECCPEYEVFDSRMMRIADDIERETDALAERVEQLESLVCDMMELDQLRHGPFSWERIDRMYDIRGGVNARLVKMGFVEEVER